MRSKIYLHCSVFSLIVDDFSVQSYCWWSHQKAPINFVHNICSIMIMMDAGRQCSAWWLILIQRVRCTYNIYAHLCLEISATVYTWWVRQSEAENKTQNKPIIDLMRPNNFRGKMNWMAFSHVDDTNGNIF